MLTLAAVSVPAARSMRGLKARTNFVYPAHQTCILSAALAASRAASGKVGAAEAPGRKFDWFTALSRSEPQRVLIDYNDVGTVRTSSGTGAEPAHDYTEVLESVERLASAISDPPRRSSCDPMNGTTTHWPSSRPCEPSVEEPAVATNSAPDTKPSNLLPPPCSASRESCEVYF